MKTSQTLEIPMSQLTEHVVLKIKIIGLGRWKLCSSLGMKFIRLGAWITSIGGLRVEIE